MFYFARFRLSFLLQKATVIYALIFGVLILACSGPVIAMASPNLYTTQNDSSCSSPKAGANKLTLTGLDYDPAHVGQSSSLGSNASSVIQGDMPILASITGYVRTYSAAGSDLIVQAAAAAHLCIAEGIGLGRDTGVNATEMTTGEQLATNSTVVHSVIVGNETLFRGDLSEAQLESDIDQVRSGLNRQVPITTSDTYDQWLQHPSLAQHVDFITVNIYPFWGGVSIDSAIQSLSQAYTQVQQAFPGKQIVIGETGWPSDGSSDGAAIPSAANQARYLNDFTSWAQSKGVRYFYFEAFDEPWKVNEGSVGPHWGLYQSDGSVKPSISNILSKPSTPVSISPSPIAAPIQPGSSSGDVYTGVLASGFGLGIDTSGQQRQWLTNEGSSLMLNYPANQQWGTMFITVGQPVPPGQRPSIDMSTYHTLMIDLRTATAGQCVRIGIKDRSQADDGSETSVLECPTTQWSTVTLPLSSFANVDLSHIYVACEVNFQGTSSISVEVRNIRYSAT